VKLGIRPWWVVGFLGWITVRRDECCNEKGLLEHDDSNHMLRPDAIMYTALSSPWLHVRDSKTKRQLRISCGMRLRQRCITVPLDPVQPVAVPRLTRCSVI
jgi:hypothetical protein